MSLIRLNLDLAIPKTVYDAIPLAKKQAFKQAVLDMKAYAVKINEGLPNEEMTVKATYHQCFHDETPPKPCEAEQEI